MMTILKQWWSMAKSAPVLLAMEEELAKRVAGIIRSLIASDSDQRAFMLTNSQLSTMVIATRDQIGKIAQSWADATTECVTIAVVVGRRHRAGCGHPSRTPSETN